jgi:hypothetical protein
MPYAGMRSEQKQVGRASRLLRRDVMLLSDSFARSSLARTLRFVPGRKTLITSTGM